MSDLIDERTIIAIEIDATQLAASFLARGHEEEVEEALENPDRLLDMARDFLVPWDNDYDIARGDYPDELWPLARAVGRRIRELKAEELRA